MSTGQKLTKAIEEFLEDPKKYRTTIGALQYLTITRPDIAFTVSKLSQFMESPFTYWRTWKHVLCYLKGTQEPGLFFKHGDTKELIAYKDSDWACDCDDKRSVGGYCVYYVRNLISWSSKKQSVVSRSSKESGYRALATTLIEMPWIQSLLHELKTPKIRALLIWCDNTRAITLAANPIYHSRTKHIEIDMHLVRDKVKNKELEVGFVPSHDQVADFMTKALTMTLVKHLVGKLCITK